MTVTTKAAGESYAFYDLMVSKYLLVTILLFVLLKAKNISLVSKHPLPLTGRCVCGVLTAAGNIYLITCLPASVAQCFNYTSSFWIVLFLFTFLLGQQKRLPLFVLLPVITGFLGILSMVNPQKTNMPFYILLIAVGYGFVSGAASLFLKRLGTLKEPTLRVCFLFFFGMHGVFRRFMDLLQRSWFICSSDRPSDMAVCYFCPSLPSHQDICLAIRKPVH